MRSIVIAEKFRSCLPRAALVVCAVAAAAVLPHAQPVAMAAVAPEINAKNWYWSPGNRWSYKNTRRIFPSADIHRGTGPVTKLEYATRDIDGITFTHPISKASMTVAEMYAQTDTDALLVLKDGKIVAERYFNGMKPEDTHLLMSTSKSVVGALAGIIVEQGRLDPQALITQYVPELKGSAYEGATVRHLLDMSIGMEFDEDYSSKTSDLYRLDEAAGWVERGPNAANGLHEYLSTLKKRHGAHGAEFRYASPNTDAMAWVLERATDTDFAQLLSEQLWSRLGAERDAYILLDGFQGAYADPGINATLRDLGRFAQMMLQNGVYNDRRIVPEEWIQDIRHHGDPQAWKNSPAYQGYKQRDGYANGSYRSYWYVADQARGHYCGIGLAGQLIVIDPASSSVLVKFSSHSSPEEAKYEIEYAGAMAIINSLADAPASARAARKTQKP
jgi:CubicO group peptidase (beta-lactamase class C family)